MKRIVVLAERQFGRISRRQLLARGFTRGWIEYGLRAGRLHVVHPGVYALGHRAAGVEGALAAAILHGGPDSALCRITALWWWELLRYPPADVQIDSPGRTGSIPGVEVRHPATIEPVEHRQLPVVAPTVALVGAATSVSYRALRRALAQAEFKGLIDPPLLHSSLGRGRPGSAILKRAIRAHMPQLARTDNDFEADFLFLLERVGIELPEVNVKVGRYRPDMLWRSHRLIVELDGKDAHTNPAQVARDHRRDLELRRLGFVVIRYTWEQVYFEDESVAADLRSQIEAARRREFASGGSGPGQTC